MGIIRIAAPGTSQPQHLVLGVMRHVPEVRRGRHVEVGRAVSQVRVARVEKPFDDRHDLLDGLRGARLRVERPHVQGFHVPVEPVDLGLRELQEGHTELTGLGQDRVVDVGDVAHHPHLVTELFEPARQQVVGEIRGGMAEVGRVVRRDAADVHAHDRPRREVGHLTPSGVEESDRHERVGPAEIPLRRRPALPLCRMLMVSKTAAKVSIPTAFSSEPPSNARRSGMSAMISMRMRRASSSSPQATTSPSMFSSRFTNSAAGTRWNAVTTRDRHKSACISLAIDPCGGNTALNSEPLRTRLFAIDTTIFPPRSSAKYFAVASAASAWTARTTTSASQAAWLFAPVSPATRLPHWARSSSTTASAFARSREPASTS